MLSCATSERELPSHTVITKSETSRPARPPRTIERALSVLDSFTIEESRWRTSDLARHCKLPVPTVHRIVAVLESFDYLRRDPATREYRLGPRAAGLGGTAPRAAGIDGLWRAARPVLRSLDIATRERVVLAATTDAGDSGIELDAGGLDDPASGPLRPDERRGPLHAGAPFKALLALMPPAEADAVIGRGLEPVGPAAITEPSLLRAELATIRRRGWAFSREETQEGRWSVAVPVLDRAGRVRCSLGVEVPLSRLDLDLARHHLALLRRSARTLTPRIHAGGDRDARDSVGMRAA